MSFDLYFFQREPGETWQDAVDRLEEAAADPLPLDDADLARWDATCTRVRPLLPGAKESTGESRRELSDDVSGIQLSLSHGELGLTMPYGYSGSEAQTMTELLRTVVVAVETATGLTAYDPQADAPFVSGGDHTATAIVDQAGTESGPARTRSDAPAGRGRFRRLFRST